VSARPKVLFVDDDTLLLKAAKRVLRKDLDLHVACGAQDGLELLRQSEGQGEPFAVLVSDQNMPGMTGTSFLAKAAQDWPLTVRVMLTGNDDQATATGAVNSGKVFRFLTKPCGPEHLLAAVMDATEQHALLTAEKDLLERTLSGSVKVLVDVLALSQPAAFKTCNQVRRWARAVGPHIEGLRSWELDVAAMLWPLGDITLPPELCAKRANGEPLSELEQEIVDQSPSAGRDLIANIPRLDGVAQAIYYSRTCFSGGGFPDDGRTGVELPLLARVLNILIDLAHVNEDAIDVRIAALCSDAGRYDPELLTLIGDALGADASACAVNQERRVFDVATPAGLGEGDAVADDIRRTDGGLLLARGVELTNPIIQKLRQLHRLGEIVTPMRVTRIVDCAA